ncbi:hypothetical protein V2J98_20475 [Pseudomonas alliivorans]|nr:hypothetical protein [Pseudomonas alliivorans]MEE4966235.1 hypothetical protein [Pseudomonas alliivorans]MEE4988749.1 hypothetical protein [Pseudomonas alliivorans]MEE4994147.1 hypothetical protein [Pseudomonas alliivorans]MEE5009328.1 hypothetical protein [Pseudomonas alliivorans]
MDIILALLINLFAHRVGVCLLRLMSFGRSTVDSVVHKRLDLLRHTYATLYALSSEK